VFTFTLKILAEPVNLGTGFFGPLILEYQSLHPQCMMKEYLLTSLTLAPGGRKEILLKIQNPVPEQTEYYNV
jgi:hypothetical protein